MNNGDFSKKQLEQRYELTELGRAALLEEDAPLAHDALQLKLGPAHAIQLLEQDLSALERAETTLGPLTRPGRPIPHQVRAELVAASTAVANAITGVSYTLETLAEEHPAAAAAVRRRGPS